MKSLCTVLLFLGRLCIAAIFISAAINKFLNYDATVAFMSTKGLPNIPLLLFLAAFVELIGGLSLVLGYKARWGALILMIFLGITTYLFHDFWNIQGEGRDLQMIMFLKNLAIFGGLIYVLACGAGCLACDACNRHRLPEDRV